MKLITQKPNQITFTAEISETLANSIRRFVNQIPVLAIDEVEISKNDSPLYDETIAHRLGLVPLKAEGAVNEKTTAELKIDVKREGFVYSGDLTGKARVVYEKIPITSLNKGQELKLVAHARAGKGVEHSKFLPGFIFYRNLFDVKIDRDCPAEVVNICPQKILELKDGNVAVTDSAKCDMCEACFEVCKKAGKDSIKIEPTKELMITIESFGQMNVKDVFSKAIDILRKELREVGRKVK